MRAHGWEKRKTNHALRAYAGAEVCLRYGLGEAQLFLTHESITTTEKHYTKQWRQANGGRESRCEWAKVES